MYCLFSFYNCSTFFYWNLAVFITCYCNNKLTYLLTYRIILLKYDHSTSHPNNFTASYIEMMAISEMPRFIHSKKKIKALQNLKSPKWFGKRPHRRLVPSRMRINSCDADPSNRPAFVAQWSKHSGVMCSRAWRAMPHSRPHLEGAHYKYDTIR